MAEETEKKRIPGPRTIAAKLAGALEQCLEKARETLGRRTGGILAPLPPPLRVGVAFSGGRDSMALLEAVHRFSRSKRNDGIVGSVFALHVNHGLSPHADEWEETCRAFCEKRGIPFSALRVKVDRKGKGVEAAARDARYQALASEAKREGLDIVLTAHHLDDRLETFLLQWIRGSGVDGLAGMPSIRAFGPEGVLLGRPWLDVPRPWIESYAASRGLSWVEDESNEDTAILRNLIRHEILPVLDRARPGFRRAAGRSVELVTEAVSVLHTVAEEDAAKCRDPRNPRAIRIEPLLALPPERQALCLREWIAGNGIEPPARATLAEALRQARETHSDTSLTIRLGSSEIRRSRGLLVLRDFAKPVRDTTRVVPCSWNGEEEVPLGLWGGVLRFRRALPDEDGFPGELLRTGPLVVRPRAGGEKIKLYRLRPSRNLKHLYQAAGIPSFERDGLPLLWCGEDLIFAAGLGSEVRKLLHPDPAAPDPDRWVVEWNPDRPLFTGS